MTNETTTKEGKRMKRIIAKKTSDFEKRLGTSKNDFETVQVINEMEDFITSEIDSWINLQLEKEKRNDFDYNEFINEAAAQVTDLRSVQNKIIEIRRHLMPSAMRIQAAMIREHKLQHPLIDEID